MTRGQLIPYVIDVHNVAGLLLTDVSIVDRFPAGFSYVKGSAVLDSVPTDALCPKCRAARHSCRNCVHFDPGARFECRQPIPKRVPSKTAANTCEFFKPETVLDATGRRIVSPGPAAPAGERVSPGRAAFEALFKKK